MRAIIFLSSLLLLTSLATSVTDEEFQEYMDKWGKVYNATQKAWRKGIFQAKVATFPNITAFTAGVNKFTDRTEEEIKRLSSLLTQPQSERKSDVLPEIKLGTPDALDWRTNNILTPVRDQGDCGVCWAFTSVGMVEAFLVQNGLQTLNIDLAEQYLAECTAGSSCDGGFIESGLDKINKKCPEESQFEYTAPTLYGGDICTATGIDTAFKRSSYYSISDAEMINLLQSGPVAVGVASTGWSDYVSGTITCSDSDQVDHAVIVVGYTADAYIIRNSWADTWGDGGYAYVSRTTSQNCHILDEAHVIAKSETYHIFTLMLLLVLAILY